MRREKLILEENYSNKQLICSQGDDSDNDDLDFVDEMKGRFNSENGSLSSYVILRRKSDGKFFQFEMIRGIAGYKEPYYQGEEVFQRTIQTTIYE